MFTIEIYYTTGDSFNTFSEVEKIGAAFPTMELAQKALKSIQDHYEFVREVETNRRYHHVTGTIDALREKVNELCAKEWYIDFFCEEEKKDFEEIYGDSDESDFLYAMLNNSHWQNYLKVDCGQKSIDIRAFWIGFFETPHNAKIVVEGSPNEITFQDSHEY